MLLAIDFDKDFIDEKGVTVTSMLSFQSTGINSTELDTPEADGFATDCDASLSEKVFYISVAEIEPIVEPDGIRNDVKWEPVAFICVHPPILSNSVL